MRANKVLITELIGQSYKQFKVPVYQRTYDWKKEHCEKLVLDIFEASKKRKEHFTGTIVYLNDLDFSNERTALLIDGQQRVTTTIILLKVITDIEKNFDLDYISRQINDKFLYTDSSDYNSKIFKLNPTEEDFTQFEHLMNNRIDKMDSSSGFYRNYQTIKNLLTIRIKTHDELKSFFDSLRTYITVIELVLDKGIDDPQEIFESINSTGLELAQADLIRNFLLMSAAEQDQLYKTYWKPLYNMIGGELLEDFMFNYLLYKIQRRLNFNDVYKTFIELFNDEKYTRESMLIELSQIAKIYNAFIGKESHYSDSVKNYLSMYKELDQTTMYPFFIKVFLDYENKLFNESELIKILKFFLNYHVRRLISGSSSGSLRGLYLNLYSRIFKIETNKARYYDSIATYINELKTKDEVPSDSVFVKNLKTTNIYFNRGLTKFLLAQVENSSSKEIVDTSTMSIEHIMPQTLETSWIAMLGNNYASIHEEFLHTLGNLTLTGYNSNLSNKSFTEKTGMLQAMSKSNFLNKDIIDKSVWTVEEIKLRSERIAQDIVKIFKPDRYNSKGIRFEAVQEYGYDVDYEDIKGKPFYSYKFINMDIERRPGSYKGMLVEIIKTLDQLDSKLMTDIAATTFNPWEDGTNDRLSTTNEANTKTFVEIREGLYLLGTFSAAACIFSIKKLMQHYQITEKLFLYYVKKSEQEDIED